ncbi:peptidoglycan-binding domain-containing protein [Streptomyces sp. NPDC046261]|uniref:peptidoglycan-binding domain-containing protein n=1 Tax=Streptomyces sp. NPDC046261 TaxID=3157200 RepID=UPI00340C73CA
MTYLLGAVAGAAVIAASSLPAAAHVPATTSVAKAAAHCGFYHGKATTRRGDRGDRVKEIQCIINRWNGGAPLKVDGVFGPRVESWVVYFQDKRGLKVDGVVGPQTWSSLRAV